MSMNTNHTHTVWAKVVCALYVRLRMHCSKALPTIAVVFTSTMTTAPNRNGIGQYSRIVVCGLRTITVHIRSTSKASAALGQSLQHGNRQSQRGAGEPVSQQLSALNFHGTEY